MTYPPPASPDPFSQQPDPYAAPATPNPYSPPPAADPYAAPPVSADPYAAPAVSGAPYSPQPTGAYGVPYTPYAAAGPATPGTNGMAIASMVLGIVGLLMCWCYGIGALPGLIGAILGHVSQKQIRERQQEGRGMAIAGIITGWSAVALTVIGVAIVAILIANDPTFWDAVQNGSSSDWD
ncbi:DUF4190 domain-containing protein [Catellatospora sp. NPDC049111]|uniref:DUF4190 domain-containing protein n=1 Tax=Catellatospora sp. NPDC049111 TaxID=3155271 RepID=UPI003403FF9A